MLIIIEEAESMIEMEKGWLLSKYVNHLFPSGSCQLIDQNRPDS